VTGADNQQERLDCYIAGYVDGEGSFSVSVQRNSSCRVGYQLVPEFHVSQNADRAQVLELIRARLGCGYIKPNARTDRALVYVVRDRGALLERVIPFFERNPLLSSKQADVETFARIVRAMSRRERPHGSRLSPAPRSRALDERERAITEVALARGRGGPESSETARQTGLVRAWKIQSELHGDMQSQAEMTWPPRLGDLCRAGSNNTVGPYPPWALGT
jgi:hypothetical protein